jgi:hypothetical protein
MLWAGGVYKICEVDARGIACSDNASQQAKIYGG